VTPTDELRHEFTQLMEDWLAEVDQGQETAWLETHLADDFAVVSALGARYTKADLIKVATSMLAADYRLREVELVRRYGDVALVEGRYFGRSTYSPDLEMPNAVRHLYHLGFEQRFTSSWLLEKGVWKCLLFQVSSIQA